MFVLKDAANICVIPLCLILEILANKKRQWFTLKNDILETILLQYPKWISSIKYMFLMKNMSFG
jgi:hypothetical protein